MKYKFGSNYVPAQIVISMKEADNKMEVIGIIDYNVDDLGNAIQEYNLNNKIFWSLHIFSCQKTDFFGEKMYFVPSFTICRSRMIWAVSSLLLHVEPL